MLDTITAPAGLSQLAEQLLPVLYQHRLVSTSQLHTLLQPHTREPRYLRRELGALRKRGLTAAIARRQAGRGELLSYVTGLGCEVVEAAGEVTRRAYRMSDQAAAGQLQKHTLAVNDVGVAFVEAARRHGHECGPLDWTPELAHRMRDGEDRLSDRALLVPDAVLHYTHAQDRRRRLLTFFIELDRATEPVATLAAKVAAYSRYHRYVPAPAPRPGRGRPAGNTREAWRERYPTFPHLLIVLTGKSSAALARRAADLRALIAADPVLHRAASDINAGVTTLDRLQAEGPFAPIVTPVTGAPTPTDVLLEEIP